MSFWLALLLLAVFLWCWAGFVCFLLWGWMRFCLWMLPSNHPELYKRIANAEKDSNDE